MKKAIFLFLLLVSVSVTNIVCADTCIDTKEIIKQLGCDPEATRDESFLTFVKQAIMNIIVLHPSLNAEGWLLNSNNVPLLCTKDNPIVFYKAEWLEKRGLICWYKSDENTFSISQIDSYYTKEDFTNISWHWHPATLMSQAFYDCIPSDGNVNSCLI